jgi:antitoxin PrlF
MILSRITAKAQTTIPQAVRRALGVKPGDDIAYEITLLPDYRAFL